MIFPVEILSKQNSTEKYINNDLTYQDFFLKVQSYKDYFINEDMKSLGILLNNCPDYAAIIFACFDLNIKFVLLNTRLSIHELNYQIKLAKITTVITDQNINLSNIKIINKQTGYANYYKGAIWNLNLDAGIIFTSGSDAKPKGVVHSIASLFSAASASNQVTGFSANNEWLVSLPFYHIASLQILIRSFLSAGKLRILEKQSVTAIIEALENKPADYISMVPTQLQELIDIKGVNFISDKLKIILLGGAPSSQKLINDLKKLSCQVLPCYGMTETGSHFTCVRLNDSNLKFDTVGKALPNVEIKLNSDREICIKTPQLAKYYFNEAGQTKIPEWFQTGDIGEIDLEGNLKIIGRKNRFLISGGENISLNEIEAVAIDSGLVKEAAAISVPDKQWGERPALFVVLNANASEENLKQFLSDNLAKFKQPNFIKCLEKIPKTSIGKVDYKSLEVSFAGAQPSRLHNKSFVQAGSLRSGKPLSYLNCFVV